jgi:hypothetical protein
VKVFVFRVLLLQVEAESEVSEFLSVLKLGTRNVYRRGLEAFNEFYSSKGSIRDFLDCVERDRFLPRNQRKRVDRMTLNNFVAWLHTSQGFHTEYQEPLQTISYLIMPQQVSNQ